MCVLLGCSIPCVGLAKWVCIYFEAYTKGMVGRCRETFFCFRVFPPPSPHPPPPCEISKPILKLVFFVFFYGLLGVTLRSRACALLWVFWVLSVCVVLPPGFVQKKRLLCCFRLSIPGMYYLATLLYNQSSTTAALFLLPFFEPLQHCGPVLGTNHLELEWFVPKTGLQC